MSDDWSSKPYPGGSPVKVKGFPRPLYPPDVPPSSGYSPSSKGPDVQAYKRGISRLGRWPWQQFDDGYWTDFAHGKTPKATGTSGVAGFQYQQKISASGWLGKSTFDNLRYALVPKELQNGGQLAMDKTAIDMINEAWDQFAGPATAPGPSQPLTRKWIGSPNYSSRGGAPVRLAVIHTAEGARPSEELGNFFASTSSGVPSHTGADDKAGVIGEYVKRGNKAWTAMNANPVAVQIELCAFAKWSASEWNQHPTMLQNCARWVAEE